MISVSRYPEHILDNDIDIYPEVSHDIWRILDTIPNSARKQFRTHKWGYASIPPSRLYRAYILLLYM